MNSAQIKAYIVNTIMQSPRSYKELCARHGTSFIPKGYLDSKMWSRVSKHVIKSSQEELTKLPFEAITDMQRYGTVYSAINYPVVIRMFVSNPEKWNGNSVDCPDDCQVWVVTDSTDTTVVGWSFECD